MRLERTEQVKPLNCCTATHQIQTAHLCNGLTCSWTVPKTMKRSRHASSSEDSDNGSNSTCWSQHSKLQPRRGKGTKPSEVFRTDLITAMKVHDSHQLNPDEYYILADPWRQEWEKGVQVPVSPQSIPHPVARVLAEKGKEVMFTKPKKLIRISRSESLGYVDIRTLAEGTCRYDLDEEDVAWIQIINEEFTEMGIPVLDEITMERVIEEFECRCHDNMTHAVETEEGLGIEYDEDVVCDVCQSPDGEDNNEMVFCDKCNICVHQACYGIQKVPKGSWLCRICALGILPKCQLCPKKGGAMKPTRSGTKWVHVSCALWIPEVSIGNPEKMEPITNVNHIPSNRWALICCVCKEKRGACIQCSAKNCRTAFHVTCGLSASLEMNTILTEDDEVKFKSYCPKHSGLQGSEARDSGGEEEEKEVGDGDKKGKRRGRVREEDDEVSSSSFAPPELPSSRGSTGEAEALSSQQQEEKRVNLRKTKLQALEEEFFQFVDAEEVAQHLKLSQEAVDFMYQYWKLKRKANFNQPLLTPKKDEEESLARREQEVLLRRLQLFTHLRQDLERVRNLTYMVTRREKMKRSLWRVQEQIFHHQVRLLDHELLIGDASAKDLEKIFSLGWLSSQGSQSGSSWGQSSLKTKRGTSKHERRKGLHRKHLPNYPQPQKDGISSNPLDTKDGDGEKLKESVTVEVNAYSRVQNMDDGQGFQEFHYSKGQKAEVREDANHVKLQRPENRPEPRREAPWPEPHHKEEQEVRSREEEMALTRQKQESDDEDEEEKRRSKKRKNEPTDCTPIQTKIRLGLKPLEKTVSIRLVDIRASDFDEYSKNTATASKSLLTPDPYTNVSTKANKNHSAPNSLITKPGKASVILEHCGSSTKPYGLLRKPPANNSSSSSSHSASNGHLKNWGKFRIPKRSERPPGVAKEKLEGGAIDPASLQEHQRKSFLRPPANTTEASYPRTRLRTGAENEVFTPSSNAKPSDDEVDHCLKRCHSHQLRGDASITRRYGNNIIRRGVLAS